MTTNKSELLFGIFIFIYIVLAALSGPIHSDGGWNMMLVNNFIADGNLTCPILDLVVFQVKIFMKWFLFISDSPIYDYRVFRIHSILLTFAATFYVYKFGEEFFKDKLIAALITMCYALFSSAENITVVLRGESVYAPLCAIVFAGLYLSFFAHKSKAYALTAIALSPLAICAHPVGGVSYIAVMLFLLLSKQSLFKRAGHGVLYSLYCAAVFYFIAVYPNSLAEIIYGVVTSNSTASYYPPYMEVIRYMKLILVQKKLVFFYLVSAVGLFYFTKNYQDDKAWKKFSIICIFSTLGIFAFIRSKWPEYFSALFFFFSFGIGFLVYTFANNKKAISCCLVACAMFMFSYLWVDFFKNELFIADLNLPNYRVTRIENLKAKIKGETVIAPCIVYPAIAEDCTFLPLERILNVNKGFEQKADHIIWPAQLRSLDAVKEKVGSTLTYEGLIDWQGGTYEIYKTNY